MSEHKGFDREAFGERLKKARKLAKLSQREVAARMEVEQPTVSRWEKGTVPDLADVVRLCELYRASLSPLVLGDDARSVAEAQIDKIREILATRSDAAEADHASLSRRRGVGADRLAPEQKPRKKAGG